MVLLEMSASDRINATTTARQQLSKQLGPTYERQFVDINRGRSTLAELCLTDVRPRAFAIVKPCRSVVRSQQQNGACGSSTIDDNLVLLPIRVLRVAYLGGFPLCRDANVTYRSKSRCRRRFKRTSLTRIMTNSQFTVFSVFFRNHLQQRNSPYS